tara:strand:- start:156 stop:497 length:342 start_codon:yes stop_codon:yes gene_type:complete
MSSWGKDVNSKPKNLRGEAKDNCTADMTGWTAPASGNDNPNAQRETLVAVRGITNVAKPAPKPVAKPAPKPVAKPAPTPEPVKPIIEHPVAKPAPAPTSQKRGLSSLFGIDKT